MWLFSKSKRLYDFYMTFMHVVQGGSAARNGRRGCLFGSGTAVRLTCGGIFLS